MFRIDLWCKSAHSAQRSEPISDERYNRRRLGFFAVAACPRVGEYIIPREGMASLIVEAVHHVAYYGRAGSPTIIIEVPWIAPEELRRAE